MNKTRKNHKKGGGNNWKPNRSSKYKLLYLTNRNRINKDLDKYFNGDTLDLSSYQKKLIEGNDEEKDEARSNLKDLLNYLRYYKKKLRSYNINVGILVLDGLGIVLNISRIDIHTRAITHAIKEIKIKISIDDVIQTVAKLLKDTDVETTTLNPLIYKKINSKPKNVNIVERNGELTIKETNQENETNRKTFEPTSVN